ncbi:MAG: oligosaccharide flippase family protein, partial [Candidatus Omnitrophica bacterium]|nr:oligosaccharide flippase family protein [Candidatus Omnitrophota bacterium]
NISIAREALWVIILALAMVLKAGLPAIIVGRLLCSSAEGLAVLFFSRRFVKFKLHWEKFFILQILRESWPFALTAFSSLIYIRIDQVMLYKLTDVRQLGYYAAAVRIADLPAIVPAALMTAMFPVLSQVVSKNELFERYMNIAFRCLAIVIFGLAAFITLGSPTIITLPFGKEYLASAPVLSLLIWSGVGTFFSMAIYIALTAKGLQRIIPLSTVLGAMLNIFLNIFLIPKWGIMGASLATVISYNFSGYIFLLFLPVSRSLAMKAIKTSLYPFISALACILILKPFPQILSLTLSPIIFTGFLFIFGAWRISDIRLLWDSQNA